MVGAARGRIDLLGGAGAGTGPHSPLLQGSGNAGLLLRERGMLSSTNAALDEVMGTAQVCAVSWAACRYGRQRRQASTAVKRRLERGVHCVAAPTAPAASTPAHLFPWAYSCPAMQAVSGSLGQQRAVFEGVTGKLGALGAKFPVVNTLMNAIRRRKNRVRRGRVLVGERGWADVWVAAEQRSCVWQ